ncbi:MAG: oligoendopeptidase F, partial [Tissierellales bacterium]
MSMEKVEPKERKDIPVEYTWDLESMYKSVDEWKKDLDEALFMAEDIEKYKGKVGESAKNLLNALNDMGEVYRKVSNVYTYAHMKLDEDTRISSSQALFDKAFAAYVKVQEKTSFIIPEVLQIDEKTMEKFYREEEGLKLYEHYLNNIFRKREHILSAEMENLLAQIGEIASAPENIYSMLNDADLKFPTIKEEKGNEIEITQANFIPLMESKDRNVRKSAFEKFYNTYYSFKNTFAQTLN